MHVDRTGQLDVPVRAEAAFGDGPERGFPQVGPQQAAPVRGRCRYLPQRQAAYAHQGGVSAQIGPARRVFEAVAFHFKRQSHLALQLAVVSCEDRRQRGEGDPGRLQLQAVSGRFTAEIEQAPSRYPSGLMPAPEPVDREHVPRIGHIHRGQVERAVFRSHHR